MRRRATPGAEPASSTSRRRPGYRGRWFERTQIRGGAAVAVAPSALPARGAGRAATTVQPYVRELPLRRAVPVLTGAAFAGDWAPPPPPPPPVWLWVLRSALPSLP